MRTIMVCICRPGMLQPQTICFFILCRSFRGAHSAAAARLKCRSGSPTTINAAAHVTTFLATASRCITAAGKDTVVNGTIALHFKV